MAEATYDSKGDTLEHSLRVGALMVQIIQELSARSVAHDLSKTRPPEKAVFDEFSPKLRATVYGSDEYSANLKAMAGALEHHYANNAHHPEFGEPGLEWRPVEGYAGAYEVSNYGDVRSLRRVAKRAGPTGDLSVQGGAMRAFVTAKGYLRLQLTLAGAKRNFMVHRLVAAAFIPNPENKPEVNHRNGDKKDNRASNLEWATESENQRHAYATGLREPNVKHVVHCPELNLTTFGAQAMERELRQRGHELASAAGIWGAMDRGTKYLGLSIESTLLADYRRSRLRSMTLIDLSEMLCDWKAASERNAKGDLAASLEIQRERFGIGDDLYSVLLNTARHFGWLPTGGAQ